MRVSVAFSKTKKLYIDSFSNHPKEIWALAVVSFINRLGTMVLPFLSLYLITVLKFSLKDAGLLMAAFGFGSFLGSYLGGKVSDKIGPNNVIMLSLFLGGITLISVQFLFSFYGLFLVIFLSASVGEAYRPAMTASLANIVPSNKISSSMALIRLAINLGFSAAPALGGFIAAAFGYKWLFWIDGLSCIIAAGYFYFVSKAWKKIKVEHEISTETDIIQEVVAPYRNKKYLIFLLGTFVLAFSFMQWFQIIPVFIKSEWGLDERFIGMLMAVNGILITLFELPLIHKIEEKGRIKTAMLIGLVLVMISFLPFALPKSIILAFLAMALLTFGEMLYLPFNNSIPLHMSSPKRRGDYVAWYYMTWSLTRIIAPAAGLAFADHFGFSAFWIFTSSIILISIIIDIKLPLKF